MTQIALTGAGGVFQGSNVRTGDGTPAWMLYQEVGATPTSFATTQAAMAASALKGSRASLRDARKTYIQSDIDKPGRPRTWLRLPKSLWPKSWFNADGSPKYHDPVVILRKSLYGHPESGPMWDKKMHQCMYQAGFLSLEGSPGFFYHPTFGVECTVYVDDLVLIAPSSVEAEIWKTLDAVVEFKDPAVEVSRYLGVYHHFGKLPDGTITCATEAKSYLTAAVKRYMDEINVEN